MTTHTEPEPATLVVEWRGSRTEHPFGAEPLTVGRGSENTVVLGDPRASRRHLRLERREGRPFLVDTGSQNGTFLNGRRVRESFVEEGDLITVGTARLRLHPGSPTSTTSDGFPEGEDTVGTPEAPPVPRSREARLRRVAEVTLALNADPTSDALLEHILDAAIDLTGSERGFLLTSGKEGMEFAASRNIAREQVKSPEFEVSWSIAIGAGTRGETVLAVNAAEDPRFAKFESVENLGLRSVMAVPVPGPKGLVGAIYVDNRLQRGSWDDDDREALELLAAQAGIALTNRALVRDLLEKADEVRELNGRLEERLERQGAELERMRARRRERSEDPLERLVGDSARMDELRHLIRKVAATDLPVLVQAESGTGKELVAKSIHELSNRAGRRFVSLNCAAVPESLLENELFGHQRGAFTGADADKAGLFEVAHGGSLFLDEVSEMSPAMQSRLLRVLQEGEFRRVGGKDTVHTDARVIAACNRDLEAMVREGSFREDLYYRLRVLPVTVPPLRERREDIPALVQHFLKREGTEPLPRITPEAMDLLTSYAWPGNVRELENEIRRLLALAGPIIDRDAISRHVVEAGELLIGKESTFEDLNELVETIETREIKKALSRSRGNKTKAAELLGITRFTLQRKLEKYAIDADEL